MTVTEDAPAAAPASSPPTGSRPGGDRAWRRSSAPATTRSSAGSGSSRRSCTSCWPGPRRCWVAVERIDAAELGAPSAPDWFAQVFTFRSIAGAFLFLLPLTIGVATLVVPLQVGAATHRLPPGRGGRGLDLPPRRRPRRRRLRHRRRPLRHRRRRRAALPRGLRCSCSSPLRRGLDLHRHHRHRPAAPGAVAAPASRCSPGPRSSPARCGSLTLPVLAGMRRDHLPRPPLRRRRRVHRRRRRGQPLRPHRLGVRPAGGLRLRHPGPRLHRLGGPGVQRHPPPAPPRRHGPHRRLRRARPPAPGPCPRFGADPPPWLYEAPVGRRLLRRRPARCSACSASGPLTAAPGHAAPGQPAALRGRRRRSCSSSACSPAPLQAIEPIETLVDERRHLALRHHRSPRRWRPTSSSPPPSPCFGGVVYWAPKILGRQSPRAAPRLVALLLLARHGAVGLPRPRLRAPRPVRRPRRGRPPTTSTPSRPSTRVSAIGGGVLALAGARLRRPARSGRSQRRRARATIPGPGTPSSGPPARRPPTGNFASLPAITSEAPLYDARHQPEEATA